MKQVLWFKFNYPLQKAMNFMSAHGWSVRSHVVIIGPIGFCILWRTKCKEATK